MNWEILDSQTVVDAPWLRVTAQRLRMPSGNVVAPFHHCWEPTWVAVIPVLPDGRIVLVEQYRHGIGAVTWEFPGGNVDSGEDLAQAALREMQEECGCTPISDARPLGWLAPNPCRNTCIGHGYQVDVADSIGPQQTEDGEDIRIRIVDRATLEAALADGRFCHAAHVAWYYRWVGQAPSPRQAEPVDGAR